MLVLLIMMAIAIPLAIISQIIAVKKGGKAKIMDELYAYMTFIQFWARLFLVGNLWAYAEVFTFALTFMNIACTSVLSLFFYFLFMEPIFIHSPHFKTIKETYKKTFLGLVITSWIVGVNFIRLIFCSVFATKSTTTDLHSQGFFVRPLNNMANITMVFNGIDFVSCMVVLFSFTVGNDAWALAVFAASGDCVLCLFQLVKIFQMRKFDKQYQQVKSQ